MSSNWNRTPILGLTILILGLWLQPQSGSTQQIGKPPHNDSDRAVFGIDISHYQPHINWTTVADVKIIKFAFTKATEGDDYLDPKFDEHWAQFHKLGIAPGAYHFYRLDKSVEANFENVKKNLFNRVNFTREGLFAVDFESNYAHRKPVDVAADLYKFLLLVEEAIGFKPFIYTYALFWKEHIGHYHDKYPFGSYPLWIAHYTPSSPNIPTDTWTDYKIWQFTSSANVEGITDGKQNRVDCSMWKNPPEYLFTAREN